MISKDSEDSLENKACFEKFSRVYLRSLNAGDFSEVWAETHQQPYSVLLWVS